MLKTQIKMTYVINNQTVNYFFLTEFLARYLIYRKPIWLEYRTVANKK